MIARALKWWTEGIAEAILSGWRLLRPPRRYHIDPTMRPYVLVAADARTARDGREIEVKADTDPAADALLKVRGSEIDIVLPATAILEKRMLSLPAESRPYVRDIAQNQIENLFPWSAEGTLYQADVIDRPDSRIDVRILATSRSAIAPVLAIAKAHGCSAVGIVGREGEGDAEPKTLRVLAGDTNEATSRRARTVANYAIAALLLCLALVLTGAFAANWSLENELSGLDQAIADRRAILKRASQSGNVQSSGVEARRRNAVPAVMVLEALSEILPDDTYLTDLALEGARLRISGVTSRAPDIVPLLEQSGKFARASFYAPTTRVSGSANDRFSIEATIVPRSEDR